MRWLAPPLVALITFATFLPILQNGFADWDDPQNLINNPHYRGLGWGNLRWMLTTTLMGHWIPLTWLTFGVDYLVWGMNPVGYHLTNLMLHTAGGVAFYFVALRLLRAATTGPGEVALRLGAGAAALFFAIHPLRVESVAWATERRDVLSGLWFLLTILTYLKAAGVDGARRRWWLAGSVGCYVLAVASKSIVMTLPLVLFLLDIYPLRRLEGRWRQWTARETRRIWTEKIPYLLLGLGAAGMALYAVRLVAEPPAARPLAGRIAAAIYGLEFYLRKTAVPFRISPLYEIPPRVNPLAPPMIVSALAVAALTAGLLVLRRKWPAGLAVWASYAVLLAPVSGIIQSGPSLVAARYSYLPCLGWALLAGAAVGRLAHATATGRLGRGVSGLGAAAVVICFAALGTLTWEQVRVWHDPETFWSYAVSVTPSASIAHNNLGAALLRQGKVDEAEHHFWKALKLRHWYADAYANLGAAAVAHNNLGVALLAQGNLEGAIHHFRRALEINPDFRNAKKNLERALARLNR